MKNIFFSLLLLLPLCGSAQMLDAESLLDKAIATMKAESPLQVDYSYEYYYDGNESLYEKGVLRLDGNRYALVMDNFGVWCDGETQWSYTEVSEEVYITDASSNEAQNFSPLFIMENYRNGCSKNVEMQNGVAVVTLQVPEGNDIERVVLSIDVKSNRLKAMSVFMSGQEHMDVVFDRYQIKCDFAPDVYKCPIKELDPAEIVDMR